MTDTVPATETDSAAHEATALSDALSGRHTGSEDHNVEQQIGDDPQPEPAPEAAPAAEAAADPKARQPAPKAAKTPAAPPATAQPAPAADAGAPDIEALLKDPRVQEELSKRAPRWAREGLNELNRLRRDRERPTPAPAAQAPSRPEPAPQRVPIPNPAEDPEGYHRAVTGHFSQQMAEFALKTTLNTSERFAVQQHGREALDDVKAWLGTQPEELENYFLRQPDPWGTAIAHYQREMLAEEIGDDPAAYKARLEQQIREQVAAEFAAQQGQEPQHIPAPRTTMRPTPPPPASTARSAQPRDGQGRYAGPTPLSSVLGHRRAPGG